MFSYRTTIASALQSFRLDGRMLCYTNFVPKLYNWCLSLGFTPGKIIPSRAFCSDETQGFPIILLTKHFAAFPFNHGRVGGIVSIDRHGPYAEHGKDLMLIQASHVGYDPETGRFGVYRRLHTEHETFSCNCGKIGGIIANYAVEYTYARDNIRLVRHQGQPALLIDNHLISRSHERGLFLVTENLVQHAQGGALHPLSRSSTGHIFPAARDLIVRLGENAWPHNGSVPIGNGLAAEDFYFKHDLINEDTTLNQLEYNLLAPMPWILTSPNPLLTAACANTMAEFDRTYRSLAVAPAMQGRNVLFISGLNIDISPGPGEEFPLTKFVPWAAYLQHADGTREILEQDALLERLGAAPSSNPAQINLEQSIEAMAHQREVEVRL